MSKFIDDEVLSNPEIQDTNEGSQTAEDSSAPVEEIGSIADLGKESSAVAQPDTQPSQSNTSEDEDVPDKYKGKSAKEIARMHQEAERALGRQGSEVGELRRIVDQFIQSQNVQKQQQSAPKADEEIDFFVDPQQAINQAIAKHPKVQQAEQVALELKKAEAFANLKNRHPDFKDIVVSTDFAEWVGKSKVRQELFVRADKGFDLDAADELLSTYKERKQIISQTQAVEQIQRKQAVKDASTGNVKGSSESSSKKKYRRQDIIELMIKDPDRYAALQPEIMAAYAEKRVI
jgi:hypothetical protein